MAAETHRKKVKHPERSILLLASGQSLTQTRQWVLEEAGYAVVLARTTSAALAALRRGHFEVVLIGVGTDALHLPRVLAEVRRQPRKLPVVTMIDMPDAGAEARVEPLAGPEGLLRVLGETIVAAHGHHADPNECLMFVDRQRRYFHVTDSAAELLGYKREELLGRRIDDISAPDMQVAEKFQSYVRDGSQHGVFSLRHRNGSIIRVRYAARVLEDGCMVSRLNRLEPVDLAQDSRAS